LPWSKIRHWLILTFDVKYEIRNIDAD
jgi:hypothetical protein